MTIQVDKGGGTMITGVHIDLYQMLSWKGAIKLEMKGLRHSSGKSVSAIVARQFGLSAKTPKQKVLEKLEQVIDAWLKDHPNSKTEDGK